MVAMSSWNDVEKAAPDLAAAVRGRIDAHGLAILATVRSDGWPRLSGIEPLFAVGELWLGSMPRSRKADDMDRDGRIALHNATTDKNVAEGDVKITGRAVAADEPATQAAFVDAWRAAHGTAVPEPFRLYRVDVTELAMIRPAEGQLAIDSWRVGSAPKRVLRS
jgi:nitroimidazol reductase NimA-like FMN-containing flavoprotein (pyridoxamine 5'-phosphate oxidase superfamily)